ncbi:MAG: chromosome segregation protein SMC [Gammaproteobacteria bacterium]
MQLLKIKISGFKSFVDPTTIALPSKLIAIVGPNGCGKSNIIDAVTWVMGESSPKYLRGESLTDVIFNGSNGRKPIGQASVELVFDNTDGTIGGEYASYAEISVKRQINRESDSTYFLNGARCRKRDVVALFLGTGLGPRSYSIIGQNMITRLIEAKPDDLRAYLEEAAGISKYKERRHETELRIGHTKENLARVNDVCGELEKQLNHLKNQANVAEKFKVLKQQERVLRAELLGIQWRQLDGRMIDYTLQIQREETALEARNSEVTEAERDIEQMRQDQRSTNETFQEIQRRFYAAGNEITRIEQDVLHHEEKQKQRENDLKQTGSDSQLVQDQVSESEDQLQELEYDIQSTEPKLTSASEEADFMEDALAEAEEAVQAWQTRWDEFNANAAKTTQTAQVEQTQIRHLEQRIASLQHRQEQLLQDQGSINFSELNEEVSVVSQKSDEMSEALETQSEQLAETRENLSALQLAEKAANSKLDGVRSELQRLRGQQASLEALQQTALGQRNNPTASWVAQHDLSDKPRLAQHIEVENGWELAVEKVLGFCLQAICVDGVNDIVQHLGDFKSGNLCLFTPAEAKVASANVHKGVLLSQKVKSKWALDSLVAGIYVADSLEDALTLCESLDAAESVVTRDGLWLNRGWLKILRQDDPAAGVFQREQELKTLALRIDELIATQEALEDEIANQRQDIEELEQQRDHLQQSYNQQQAQYAQIAAQLKMKQERLLELEKQAERFRADIEEGSVNLQQAQGELTEARSVWEQAMNSLEQQSSSREDLVMERDKARQQLQSLRENANQKKSLMHELEIRVQTAKSQKTSLAQNIVRLKTHLASLEDRKSTLQRELSGMPAVDALKEALSLALEKHVVVENELNTARAAVDALEQAFRKIEEKRQLIERESAKIRSKLESLRVECQGWKVKSETILEQFKETEFQLEDVLKDLAQDISTEEWQAKVDQTAQRIHRLGPINLVAIDEYATCLERKEYLDKQVADLQDGLATLEDAIAKIDKETKQRFKETFDKVNARFQELFPTIFGGGKAYLELTGEDLLEAGVTMMACPPGKRNSSIHLLSGGEKSLTAIALIFSIFHLNPAPFCLLDEVDAALDDANVLRFTRLVKVMAEKTQFLFISHNNLTIEMGEHLVGVTMNEPGVSRLVSVDLEKAISLAAS